MVGRKPLTLPLASISTRCRLKEGRTARKQAIFPLLRKVVDHGRQVDVGEAVAVVGEKHLLALDVLAHGKQALADVAPESGVDHGDAPVSLRIAKGFDVVAEAGDDAIGIDVRPVIEEELLDDIRLVAEAQNEVSVTVLAVVLHQMPKDRLVADRDHRLRDVFRVIADARAKTAAEENCFHVKTLSPSAPDDFGTGARPTRDPIGIQSGTRASGTDALGSIGSGLRGTSLASPHNRLGDGLAVEVLVGSR